MLSVRADEPTSDHEWRDFLSSQDFGQLIAPGIDRELQVVIPAHYIFDGQDLIELHLHRDNPVWDALEESPSAIFSTLDDIRVSAERLERAARHGH